MGDVFVFLIALIVFIIQVILIVKFWKMCNDVRDIKRSMIKVDLDAIRAHNKHKLFGHNDKARLYLEDYIWQKMQFIKENYDYAGRVRALEILKEDIEPKLIEVGGMWPDIKTENL